MFEARLTHSAIFRKILDAIKDLLTEATFDCTDTGIQLQAMDRAHVSLVCLSLENESFDNYRCDRNLSMGMSIVSMLKILKFATPNDTLTMRAVDNPDVIEFTLDTPDKDVQAQYEMKLINLDQEHLGIPDVKYDCVVNMPSTEFAKAIRDISQFGENITIACTKNGIEFSAAGDTGAANIKLAQTADDDAASSVTIVMQEPVKLSFSCRYMNCFIKATPLCNQVQLSLAPDKPLVCEFKIAETGHIRYYLAPKIDEEEDA